MDVIERLRAMMAERSWSEYRLAKEASLAQSTITNIFHRNTLPSIPTLKTICDAFGITLSQFFADAEWSALSAAQMELLNDWSGLTPAQKHLVKELTRELADKRPPVQQE